jgi:hypothetical protein
MQFPFVLRSTICYKQNLFNLVCAWNGIRLDPAIAAEALKVIEPIDEFSAADQAIWRITRPIKRMAECCRIRVTRDYRLLLRWVPDNMILALDLIPRAELETWIGKKDLGKVHDKLDMYSFIELKKQRSSIIYATVFKKKWHCGSWTFISFRPDRNIYLAQLRGAPISR